MLLYIYIYFSGKRYFGESSDNESRTEGSVHEIESSDQSSDSSNEENEVQDEIEEQLQEM